MHIAEAFADRPALAEDLEAGNRYNAACVAALAGCGEGHDDPPLDDRARAHWRRQAGDWLYAHLALLSRQLETAKPYVRVAVRQSLEHCQRDPDLAGVRDPKALEKLPVEEREAWRKLWGWTPGSLAR